MEEVTVSLENLTIHRFVADPEEEQDAIEFQMHATLRGLDENILEAFAGQRFEPKEVVGTIQPSSPGDC